MGEDEGGSEGGKKKGVVPVARHLSEAASPKVSHHLSLALLPQEREPGAGGGHQRIDKSPVFLSVDVQKQDSGDTVLHNRGDSLSSHVNTLRLFTTSQQALSSPFGKEIEV
jgi:hypothetical protein